MPWGEGGGGRGGAAAVQVEVEGTAKRRGGFLRLPVASMHTKLFLHTMTSTVFKQHETNQLQPAQIINPRIDERMRSARVAGGINFSKAEEGSIVHPSGHIKE